MTTPEKLTPAFLATLKLGATFDTEGVLQGVSKEPLVWRLIRVTPGRLYEFSTTYYGVFFGKFLVSVRGTDVNMVAT